MNLLPFFISGIGVGAAYALSGVGLVVLYRASGTLNFAFGAVGAIGAHCAWSLQQAGYAQALCWCAAIGVAGAVSLAYGRLVAPGLAHRDRVVRSVGTLGFALILLGVTGWAWGEGPRRLALPTDTAYLAVAGVRLTYSRLLAVAATAGMIVVMLVLLDTTRLGLAMRSLACDRELSSVLGIKVVAVDSWAWLISGVFAGVAGMLLANLVRLQATFLTFLVVPAIAAAVLGRLTSLTGTAIGGLCIGILEAVLTTIPAVGPYRAAAPFVIALLFVAVFGAERGRQA